MAASARGGTKQVGGRQSKSVTVTYGAVSAVLLIVIATVALIVKPPSPPALAEFAPQPDKTIDEGPDDQSSQFGTGGNGLCTAGQVGCEGMGRPPTEAADETDTPDGRPPSVIESAALKRCVDGNPPRQIEDPQSPPCAEYWNEPDNGGATYTGVTRDEIRVAVTRRFMYSSFDDIQALAEFFNNRFQFYGRDIVIVPTPDHDEDSGGIGGAQVEMADFVAERKVFAAIGFHDYSSMPWRKRLAHHGVLSVAGVDDHPTEAELQSLHPYSWGYYMSFDKLARDLGEFVCRSLHMGGTRPAEHAGPAVRTKTRKFAFIVGRHFHKTTTGETRESPTPPPDIRPAVEVLKGCNAPASVHEVTWGDGNSVPQENLLRQLADDNVTTIIPVSYSNYGTVNFMEAAAKNNYEPEWLIAGGGGGDMHLGEVSYQGAPPSQTAHFLAMGGWNKRMPSADRPATWAYNEAGQTANMPRPDYTREAEDIYRSLLVLASGIQAAGPNLTPQSFARGLQAYKFPNPGAGAAPYYQASVGFTGDHTMINDEGLMWWSASAPADYFSMGSGGWCWVERGARWRTGQWPSRRMPFQDPTAPCR